MDKATMDAFAPYGIYELGSGRLRLQVTPYGASMVSLQYRGQELLLGYDTVQGYVDGTSYVGAIVGRYANRIGKASFTIHGQEYHVDANEQDKCLHGGRHSISHRPWRVDSVSADTICFSIHSPDGDNGFPGNMEIRVTYQVEDEDLTLTFEGDTDKDTVFGPTTHAYFNLGGQEDIRSTMLSIRAGEYVHTDDSLLPDAILPVEGWLDFRNARAITDTFDHCFVLSGGEGPDLVASYGNVRMELKTDYPGVQLYTGKYLSEPHHAYAGFAVEPEFYPDTPNHKEFPSCLLQKGEHFRKYVRYSFKTKE